MKKIKLAILMEDMKSNVLFQVINVKSTTYNMLLG
jgi:hypothetical protein